MLHSYRIIENRGTVSCTTCGLVIRESLVDTGQEWRTFADDGDDGPAKSRIGASSDPLLPAHEQMGTKSECDRLNRRMAESLRVPASPACPWLAGESHLAKGLRSLETLAKSFRLPQPVVEEARQIYHAVSVTAAERGLSKRYNVRALLVATLYYASRECGNARTFAELSQPTHYSGAKKSKRAAEKLTKGQFSSAQERIKACAKYIPWLGKMLQRHQGTVSNVANLASIMERQLCSLRPQVQYKHRKVALAALKARGAFLAGHGQHLVVVSAAFLTTECLCPNYVGTSVLSQLSELSDFTVASIKTCAKELAPTLLPRLQPTPVPPTAEASRQHVPVKLQSGGWAGGAAAVARQKERATRRAEARQHAVASVRTGSDTPPLQLSASDSSLSALPVECTDIHQPIQGEGVVDGGGAEMMLLQQDSFGRQESFGSGDSELIGQALDTTTAGEWVW